MCQHLSHDLLPARQQFAEIHGLTVEGGDMSDINLRYGFDIQFRVGIPMQDGSLFSHEKTMFEVLAPHFGLEPSDLMEPRFASPPSTPIVQSTQSAQNASQMAVASSSQQKIS